MRAIEAELLDAADQQRFGSAYAETSAVQPDSTTSVFVAGSPEQLAPTTDDNCAVGTLELGPDAMGGLVRFTPLRLSIGERITPWAVAAYALADSIWGTDFGDFEAPLEVG